MPLLSLVNTFIEETFASSSINPLEYLDHPSEGKILVVRNRMFALDWESRFLIF